MYYKHLCLSLQRKVKKMQQTDNMVPSDRGEGEVGPFFILLYIIWLIIWLVGNF